MKNFDNLTVSLGDGGQKDLAESIARKIGVPLCENKGKELTLLIDRTGVCLCGYGLTYRGDFEKMLPRITEGRLSHEMLVKIAKTEKENPTAIDATAGMGEDSFLLAAAGYKVTMFERNPVVAALLKDALRRAKKHPILKQAAERIKVIEGDSTELMPLQNKVDLIYLDPMFPERKKSGLVNKKLQLIQQLEQPCSAEEELLNAAFLSCPEKIVIKRPLKGGDLAGRKPQYSIKGKAIRYDCFTVGKGTVKNRHIKF